MSDPSIPLGLEILKVFRNGRRRYDPASKQRLVESCLEPGVSVAGLALQHGMNANLLRKWVTDYRQQQRRGMATGKRDRVPGPFIPVIEANVGADLTATPAVVTPEHPGDRTRALDGPTASLTAKMPNGVRLRLECTGQDVDLMSAMIMALGRHDVPSGR